VHGTALDSLRGIRTFRLSRSSASTPRCQRHVVSAQPLALDYPIGDMPAARSRIPNFTPATPGTSAHARHPLARWASANKRIVPTRTAPRAAAAMPGAACGVSASDRSVRRGAWASCSGRRIRQHDHAEF
jgi:hypothetical protein